MQIPVYETMFFPIAEYVWKFYEIYLNSTELLSVAPGMKEGMSFDDLNSTPQRETTFVNLADIMSAADLDEFDLGDEEDEIESKETDKGQGQIQGDAKLEKSNSLEDLVKVTKIIIGPSKY